jgi:hypothetical protein
MDDFYKYIYEKNGGYQIIKDNVYYGWYPDIRWALHDRDSLISCDWDLGEFVYIERENKYLHMRLPPRGLKRANQYVYRNNGSFRIQKKINGVLKQFGSYKTLDEALTKRDELIENGWCDE